MHRSCSGFIVTSYIKKEDVTRYRRKLDQQLGNILDQYKIFKKNLDLKFELSESRELTGLILFLNKTKYFRLWRCDVVWLLSEFSECPLNACLMFSKCSFEQLASLSPHSKSEMSPESLILDCWCQKFKIKLGKPKYGLSLLSSWKANFHQQTR